MQMNYAGDKLYRTEGILYNTRFNASRFYKNYNVSKCC